jgi:hypothetical protein
VLARPAAETGPDGLARAYVHLALRLDRVLPGVLDAHLGDPDEAARVAAESAPRPDDLVRETDRLRAALPGSGAEPGRAAALDAQLRACRVLAERAGGREVGFVEEVERCFGVRIARGEQDRYRESHRALDALLDGRGSPSERLAAFRHRDRLAPEHLSRALAAATRALRARTTASLGLPEGEDVTLEVVGDAAWSGFSRWLGPGRSAIAVNGGMPHRVTHLPLLVAHEAYPGHHTEHCRLAARRAAGTVPPEREVFLARTPQSLLAEGAAELGLEAVVGPGWGRWNAEVLAAAGVPTDPERAALGEAVEAVMADLAPVRQDAALMLHAEGRPTDEVVAHLRRWLLVDETRARRMLTFLAHPRWRTHTTTYVEGVRLLRPWLIGPAGAEPPAREMVTARLARVLDDPPAPEELRVATISATTAATARDRRPPTSRRPAWAPWLRRTVAGRRTSSGNR